MQDTAVMSFGDYQYIDRQVALFPSVHSQYFELWQELPQAESQVLVYNHSLPQASTESNNDPHNHLFPVHPSLHLY